MNILFWSGGKDAFLAYEFYRRDHPEKIIKLLTTYEEATDRVPHQNIPVKNIKRQAKKLNLDLTLVSLPGNCPNEIYINHVRQALENQPESIDNLIFGDWYVQEIRDWREAQFGDLGYTCQFPIWGKSLHELLPVLMLQPVEIRISAVKKEYQTMIGVGELYNQSFVRQLPKTIDPMGEKGEFHTEVRFKD